MGLHAEQTGNEKQPVAKDVKRFAKRQLAKKQRRQAKRNSEDAPRKNRYDGWAS
jgi:hypothetical protein